MVARAIEGIGERGILPHALRKDGFLTQWLALAEQHRDVEKLHQAFHEGLSATHYVRVGKGEYGCEPDHAVRLGWATLAADIMGLRSQNRVNVNVNDNRVAVSIDQRMSELAQVLPPDRILDEIRKVAEEFEAAEKAKGGK